MIEGFSVDLLDQLGFFGVLATGALLVITDKLVWHTRLKKAEARVERLEAMLWDSIGVSSRATETAEVTSQLVQNLPPLAEGPK